jgi:DNA polymerase V
VNAAVLGLQAIYRAGFKYAKAGVMLMDLQPDSLLQGELDLEDGDSVADIADKARLMTALDAINSRYGRGTMTMASAGVEGKQKNWVMRQERMTPRYTTCIEDMPIARAV